MVALKDNVPRFTPEEYFAWDEGQKYRHEYIDGKVRSMTCSDINHAQLGANFAILLKNHLVDSGYKVHNSQARIKIHGLNDYVYPDVSVTCDERDKTTPQYITYPCLIIEVLSPSTEAYDRGNKFRMYRRNSNLKDYVLVDSKQMAIDLYRKDESGNWYIVNYEAGESIELKSINLTCSIEQIYEDIIFVQEEIDRKL
jgi:Uma2 family endonuclease